MERELTMPRTTRCSTTDAYWHGVFRRRTASDGVATTTTMDNVDFPRRRPRMTRQQTRQPLLTSFATRPIPYRPPARRRYPRQSLQCPKRRHPVLRRLESAERRRSWRTHRLLFCRRCWTATCCAHESWAQRRTPIVGRSATVRRPRTPFCLLAGTSTTSRRHRLDFRRGPGTPRQPPDCRTPTGGL